MSFGRKRLAAVALAAAALLPWPVRASPLDDAKRSALAVEESLAALERVAAEPQETPAARAAREFSAGETQYLLGDFIHAAFLLSDAVDEPTFRGGPDHPNALLYLADALRRHGDCGSARIRYGEYLESPGGSRRGEAVSGALECAVKERRGDVVESLLGEARSIYGGELPAEIRYVAAKAIFHRTGLAPDERFAKADAAFTGIPPPFQLQADYFRGVLRVERGDLAGSLERFEACAGATPGDGRGLETRELCALALGRVHGELGHLAEALDGYARVPGESPRFTEALYETAWTYVRARQYEPALRTAALISDLFPESPLAPEAIALQGHLLLRLGRYAEATEAYSRVINDFAPIRDELDAILSMREDPVRYLNELIGRQGAAFDVATVLPPIAVKWASSQKEVASVLELVAALDRGRRDAEEAVALADRLAAVLGRANGADAFPALRHSYASAQALENAVARGLGDAAAAGSEAVARALAPEQRTELAAVKSARKVLEARLATLPRSPSEVLTRLERMQARVDTVDRGAFQLGFVLDGCQTAISGAESWLEEHRAEITADAEGRQELTGEFRRHREVIADYRATLRAVRQDVALARDAAAGSEAMADEARLRDAFLAAVDRERALARAARPSLGAGELAALDRAEALAERLEVVKARTRAVEARIVAQASERAGVVRERVAAERARLTDGGEELDAVQAEAKGLIGRIAQQSFGAVRAQFYKLVLKADVGLVDVAWARKRVRLEKIQQLSVLKAEELQQLDETYKGLLREVD